MRQPDQWTETKYVQRAGRWAGSRDPRHLGIGSRLVADLTAALYAEHLPRHARGRLVDLGCGLVPLYGIYRTLASEVTCVDWPQSVHGSPHLDVAVDLNAPLPFEDARFDTIVLSDVLEHLSEPAVLWREMARVLAPGGHLLLNTPFLYGVHEAPHDYARYTSFGLQRFAEQAGLEVRLLLPMGGSLHVLADLLGKHLAPLPALGSPLARVVQGSVELLDRTGLGRRIAQRTQSRFPLGHFMVAARGRS
jgi:SAM-dependent methyltransferase